MEANQTDLSGQIIGATIRVHETLGPGFLEAIYEEALCVELEAVVDFESIHFAITRSYLKATGCEVGLLLNFAAPTVAIKRVGREWHSRSH